VKNPPSAIGIPTGGSFALKNFVNVSLPNTEVEISLGHPVSQSQSIFIGGITLWIYCYIRSSEMFPLLTKDNGNPLGLFQLQRSAG